MVLCLVHSKYLKQTNKQTNLGYNHCSSLLLSSGLCTPKLGGGDMIKVVNEKQIKYF